MKITRRKLLRLIRETIISEKIIATPLGSSTTGGSSYAGSDWESGGNGDNDGRDGDDGGGGGGGGSSSSRVVLIGDSQIADSDNHPHGHKGELGIALESIYSIDSSDFHGARSKTPQWWATTGWEDILSSLSECPNFVLISLARSSGASDLVEKIRTQCSDVPIVWSGAVPLIGSRESDNPERERSNASIQSALNTHRYTLFIDPFEYITKSDGTPGYEDTSSDGVHLPRSVATEYAQVISGRVGF